MSSQPIGHTRPPVGILAPTVSLAESLARELHITKPVKLSPDTIKKGKLHGQQLGAMLVDESVWPLDPAIMSSVLEALAHSLGSVLLMVGRMNTTRRRPK